MKRLLLLLLISSSFLNGAFYAPDQDEASLGDDDTQTTGSPSKNKIKSNKKKKKSKEQMTVGDQEFDNQELAEIFKDSDEEPIYEIIPVDTEKPGTGRSKSAEALYQRKTITPPTSPQKSRLQKIISLSPFFKRKSTPPTPPPTPPKSQLVWEQEGHIYEDPTHLFKEKVDRSNPDEYEYAQYFADQDTTDAQSSVLRQVSSPVVSPPSPPRNQSSSEFSPTSSRGSSLGPSPLSRVSLSAKLDQVALNDVSPSEISLTPDDNDRATNSGTGYEILDSETDV